MTGIAAFWPHVPLSGLLIYAACAVFFCTWIYCFFQISQIKQRSAAEYSREFLSDPHFLKFAKAFLICLCIMVAFVIASALAQRHGY